MPMSAAHVRLNKDSALRKALRRKQRFFSKVFKRGSGRARRNALGCSARVVWSVLSCQCIPMGALIHVISRKSSAKRSLLRAGVCKSQMAALLLSWPTGHLVGPDGPSCPQPVKARSGKCTVKFTLYAVYIKTKELMPTAKRSTHFTVPESGVG